MTILLVHTREAPTHNLSKYVLVISTDREYDENHHKQWVRVIDSIRIIKKNEIN